MKATDIRQLSVEDIKAKLDDERSNYGKLKLNHKMAQIENPIQLRASRRTIARLNTVLAQKLAESKA